MYIDTHNLSWKQATKHANIRCKRASSLFVGTDATLFSLHTIEGVERIDPHAWVCIGVNQEVWQQTQESLESTYTIDETASYEGWFVAKPTKGRVVEVYQLPEVGDLFTIRALWGTEGVDEHGNKCWYQSARPGSYIVRNPIDHQDVWLVDQVIFQKTYSMIG